MIIVHSSTPSSLLKAAMISRLAGGVCLHTTDTVGALFENTEPGRVAYCDSFSMEYIRQRYEKVYGAVKWLDTEKARRLAAASQNAARHKAADRYLLIITVMQQALDKGADYVLNMVSIEARNMFNRARRVSMEIHRACGFIRFTPVKGSPHRIMVGRAEFENDIGDIVLRYFARRYRDSHVYIASGKGVYYLEGRSVRVTDAESLPFALPGDDFSGLWEAYYDSQFIEGRKNLALARKHLPKKYWSWVIEGDKLK